MASESAPFVAMRTDLVKDERVAVLAEIGGYNIFEARGRLYSLWAWCIDRKLADAPDDCPGHAVSEAVIRRYLGPNGAEAILGGGCDDFALGVRFRDGLIYLKGSDGYVRKMRGLARASSAGGTARASNARGERGRFVSEPTIDQPCSSRAPAVSPASDQPSPALSISISIPEDLGIAATPLQLQADPPALKRAPRSTRKKASGPLPDGWQPRDHERSKAASLGLNCDREAERFLDHHASKGSTFADWDAAFRTWLGNALRFQSGNGAGLQTSTPAIRVAPRADDDYSRIPGMEIS